jgi:hypothetical protein
MGKAEEVELFPSELLFEGTLMKQQKLMRTYISRWELNLNF